MAVADTDPDHVVGRQVILDRHAGRRVHPADKGKNSLPFDQLFDHGLGLSGIILIVTDEVLDLASMNAPSSSLIILNRMSLPRATEPQGAVGLV